MGLTLFANLLLMGAAVLMSILAGWMYVASRKTHFREQVASHFETVMPRGMTVSGVAPGKQGGVWHRIRVKVSIYAGFELRHWHFIGIPLLFGMFGLLGWFWLRWTGALLLFGAAVLLIGFVIPYTRLRRKQALIISQVPGFIDQVLRGLGSGRSLEGAIRLANEEVPPPLRHILERVIRAADLGADMMETLTDAAKLHGLRELGLVALAMRISSQYGSSPRDLLQSVVQMIRQRELAQRELAAMTGETRISAWVLGLTPVLVAAYILLANPSYMNLMLDDPSGRMILALALGLQGFGVLLLWRMLRSV